MMGPYRSRVPMSKLPPRAPWWRLLRARIDGTMSRIVDRRFRHDLGMAGMVRDPDRWAARGLGRHFSDAEIDRFLPPSLRRDVPV